MAKINYRQCDICGNVLKTDIRYLGFANGYRIWNRLFNKIDICTDCMKKIKQLSIDKNIEEKCWNYILNKENRKYTDDDKQFAYYQGVEDCIANLSHHKLLRVGK